LSKQSAVRDFLIYAECWRESMEHHHHREEKYDSEQVRQAYKRLEKELLNADNARLSNVNVLHEHITDFAVSIMSLQEAIGDSRASDDTTPAVPFFVP
jgi:hypothetical protein